MAAALSQSRMYVVKALSDQMTEIVDYGGQVEKYTPESIKINGAYFFRNQFEFRVDMKGLCWVISESFYIGGE
ncbi:hypothetical protein P4H71_13020 [Paenibacillus kribbensis]|nr:hypothetical protein [Paenibacillus kribbensis]